MDSAKVIIEVNAGLIPGQPMPEFYKKFSISSKDWDDETGEPVMKVYGFAQEYARNLWQPQRVNWVSLVWNWL